MRSSSQSGTRITSYNVCYTKLLRYSAGGLLWIDPALKQETEAARQAGRAFEPRVVIDKTFQRQP